jgi:hypothetical protein
LPPASSFIPEGKARERENDAARDQERDQEAEHDGGTGHGFLHGDRGGDTVVRFHGRSFKRDTDRSRGLLHFFDGTVDHRRDALVVEFVAEHEIGSGLVEGLGIFGHTRLHRRELRREIRWQVGLREFGDLLLRLSDVGLEGCKPLGVAGRQHPPVGYAHQENLRLESSGGRFERRLCRRVHELLHLGRHLVAVGEQQRAARLHLLDGIAERGAFGPQFCNVFAGLAERDPSLFTLRRPLGFVEQADYPSQTLVGFREGCFVLIECVAQDAAADRLQVGRDIADADRVLRL